MPLLALYLYELNSDETYFFCQNSGKWLETIFRQSSERIVALEAVLRWLEKVLRWLKEVLRWLEEVLRWLEEVLNWLEEVLNMGI